MTKALSPDLFDGVNARAAVVEAEETESPATLLAFEVLDSFDQGLVLINAARNLVYANRRGQVLLSQGSPLRLHDDLTVALARGPEALDRARVVADAKGSCSFTVSDGNGPSSRVTLKRLDRALRIRPMGLYVLHARATLPSTVVIRARYSLTPVEAGLVHHLLQGAEVTDAATDLRISPHTARKYLKSIFLKLEVNRQVDLVRKILLEHYGEEATQEL